MRKLNLSRENIRVLIVLSLVFLLLVIWTWFESATSTPPKSLTDNLTQTEEEPATSELTGSEKRLSYPFMNILILGLDQSGLNDLILVACYNLESHDIILIAIPRDTYVSDQNWAKPDSGFSQIGQANYVGTYHLQEEVDYDQGALYTAAWVEHLLQIPIHEYISIDFDSFVELIELIGGVELYIDPGFANVWPGRGYEGLQPLPTGRQRLDGLQTIFFARYRGDREAAEGRIPEPGSQSGDGDRIRRNQRLLEAIFRQAKGLNFLEQAALIRQLYDNVHTSLRLRTMAALYSNLDDFDINRVVNIVLPGEFKELYQENIADYTHYYVLDTESVDTILQELGLK